MTWIRTKLIFAILKSVIFVLEEREFHSFYKHSTEDVGSDNAEADI